ncbi:MAG TPA: YaeQ family protein [Vicinamibacteria bacterium]|nr:YaeQ family protein [Vicinamibacteria bacterium]
MALKSTIYKAVLHVADMDRSYYGEHVLTIARHPSETDERMMVRLLAFALNAHEHLAFGTGLSDPEAPDLWQKDLTGAIAHWIEVGQPDERAMLRACGRAGRVTVYPYRSGAEHWWEPLAAQVARARNLAVWRILPAASQALATLAARSMVLHCTVQDGRVWISAAAETAEIEPVAWKGSEPL